MSHHNQSNERCPKCEGETYQESVDIGVGIIFGPRGCTICGWSEDEKYDLTLRDSPFTETGGMIDQFGNFYPPKNPLTLAMIQAAQEEP